MIVFVTAAFLVAGAQAAFGLAAPAEQSAGVGTTGAQAATSVCPTPRLTGLPNRPKFTNATIHFKLLNMTQGAVYLVKAGKGEVLSGGADQTGTVKSSFQLPDQGTKSRKVPIELVISSDQCENSPWKLVKKIKYKAVAPPATPGAPAAGKPATPVPAKPATPALPVAPIKPILPQSNLPKLPPKGPSLKLRTWMTPIDGGARLAQAPVGPKLSRTERRSTKAKSSEALVALAALFLLSGLGAFGGFAFFKRKDEIVLEDAFGVLPQHLEEGSPDMPQPGEEPDTVPLSAHLLQTAPPVMLPIDPSGVAVPPIVPEEPVPEPVETNGNGAASPSYHREQVEAELQRLLTEAGIDVQVEGILADVREEAARQGIAIDPDNMLRALCDELDGAAVLSDSRREGLRAMFKEIIAEEAEQVPQEAS